MQNRNDNQQDITLPIHGIASDGAGVGSLEGYTVFVDGALPGEVAKVRLVQRQKRYAKGRLLATVHSSPHRTEAPCPAFGRCGGCQLMHLSYAGQLENKRQRVVDALERIAKIDGASVENCHPSPKQFAYRNKIQLPVRPDGRKLLFGLYERSSHHIVAVDRCLIHCELGEKALQAVKYILQDHNIIPFDDKTGKGELRHLLIKSAVNTSQSLVVLVTSGTASPRLKMAAQQIVAEIPYVKGVVHNIQSNMVNTILGDQYHLLAGVDAIEEVLCGLTFKVSPASFFQVNPEQAEILYRKAISLAQLKGNEVVLDAYCGVGTMALIMSSSARHVIGVECVAAAIEDAKINAQRNNVNNSTFLCGTAETLINSIKEVDVVFLNPPRKGCEESMLKVVAKLRPRKIIYVSCDPATLARDLAFLTKQAYTLDVVYPFDMFPQTSHVECVASLTLDA